MSAPSSAYVSAHVEFLTPYTGPHPFWFSGMVLFVYSSGVAAAHACAMRLLARAPSPAVCVPGFHIVCGIVFFHGSGSRCSLWSGGCEVSKLSTSSGICH